MRWGARGDLTSPAVRAKALGPCQMRDTADPFHHCSPIDSPTWTVPVILAAR